MHAAFPYILSIVAFVIVLNFVMLFFRLRRDRSKRPSRPVLEEERAAELRHNEIRRRLEREERLALEHIELRNKTLALYDEVRRRAAAREKEAATASEIEPENALQEPLAALEPLEPPEPATSPAPQDESANPV